MGTRHLTAVKLDGKFKVAQYGQWDGYLEGEVPDSEIHIFVELGLRMPTILNAYFQDTIASITTEVEGYKGVIAGDLVEGVL